jgi:hypothetical protein
LPVLASGIEIAHNEILGNARGAPKERRGGIVLAGGQDGDQGTLVLKNNVIRGNGGPGILKSRLRLVVDSTGNDVSGNEAG